MPQLCGACNHVFLLHGGSDGSEVPEIYMVEEVHDLDTTGAVLHYAGLPALPSGVRLQAPQGLDLLLHQQRCCIPVSLLRLLSKGL